MENLYIVEHKDLDKIKDDKIKTLITKKYEMIVYDDEDSDDKYDDEGNYLGLEYPTEKYSDIFKKYDGNLVYEKPYSLIGMQCICVSYDMGFGSAGAVLCINLDVVEDENKEAPHDLDSRLVKYVSGDYNGESFTDATEILEGVDLHYNENQLFYITGDFDIHPSLMRDLGLHHIKVNTEICGIPLLGITQYKHWRVDPLTKTRATGISVLFRLVNTSIPTDIRYIDILKIV